MEPVNNPTPQPGDPAANSPPQHLDGMVFSPPAQVPPVSAAPRPMPGPAPMAPQTIQPSSIYPEMAPANPAAGTIIGKPKRRFGVSKKLVLLGILPILLLLGGGAAAYFYYYAPTQPGNLWGKSLVNMGKGYDKISDYLNAAPQAKGEKLTGTIKTTGDLASDGTFSEQSYGDNGQFNLSYSAEGIKVGVDALTLQSTTSNPDVYFKVSGLDGLSSLLGADGTGLSSTINQINGQWYFVDHSLLDQYTSSLGVDSQFTKADLNAVIKAVGDPSKKYVFTDNTQNMAFVIKQSIGKETVDGRSTYHYKIGLNKANFKAYNNALCDNILATKLGKELTTYDSSFSTDCKDTSDIDSVKDSSTADVWVDTRTKLIHKVQFNGSASGDFFALTQDYQGGNKVPLGASFASKSGSTKLDGQLGLTLDLSSHVVNFNANVKVSGDTNLTATVNYTASPSNTQVKVDKPANPKDFLQLITDLENTGLLGDSGSAPAAGGSDSDVLNTILQ